MAPTFQIPLILSRIKQIMIIFIQIFIESLKDTLRCFPENLGLPPQVFQFFSHSESVQQGLAVLNREPLTYKNLLPGESCKPPFF